MNRTTSRNSNSAFLKRRGTIVALAVGAAAALLAAIAAYWTTRDASSAGSAGSGVLSGASQQLHVSPAGNDSGEGSQAAPLRTIQAALERATPGSVINLAPGDYREQPVTRWDGTPDAPITIRGPEEGTDPSGRYVATLYGTGRVFSIDHSHYTLEGFTIDGQEELSGTPLPTDLSAADAFKDREQANIADSKLIYIGAADESRDITGVTIRNMFLTEAGTECVRLRNNAHGNTIADSVIQYCGLFGKDDDGGERSPYHNGEGVYIGTSPKSDGQPMADNDTSSHNVITGNIIRTFGSECFNVKENAHDNLFENNVCADNAESAEFNGSNIELRGHNNVLRGNVISGSAGFNVKIQSDDEGYDNGGNSLENNHLSGPAAEHLRIEADDPQEQFCGNVVTSSDVIDGNSPGDITAPCPSGGSAPDPDRTGTR
jgi:hypothetical protein